MGVIRIPDNGPVYFDSMCFIYSVERHPVYRPVLIPVWSAARANRMRIATSERAVVETLVGPYRSADPELEWRYEQTLSLAAIDLHGITTSILRRAARLRADVQRLRTPDAIHAATALEYGAALFVTNDPVFRHVPGLPVEVLSDVVSRT